MRIKKYRIVTDNYAGYEVQVWTIWFPFWVQVSYHGRGVNTFPSLDAAIHYIRTLKRGTVVWKES